MKIYLQVIIPVRLGWIPWYVTSENVSVGARVRVKLGRREYVGVVYAVSDKPDIEDGFIQEIISVESALDPVSEKELSLWQFLYEYYLCTIGEVYKFAYPSLILNVEKKKKRRGIKPSSSCNFKLEDTPETLEVLNGTERHKPVLLSCCSLDDKMRILDPLVARALTSGKNILYLVPDKIESSAIERHLGAVFGDRLLVCNSDTSPAQRRNIASALRTEEPFVVLGTRMSVFLPFNNIGLVIVDDEQDRSYKQDSPSPRYNGRDTAVMLASIHGADVILTSATPSLESLYNVQCGRFVLVDVPHPSAGLTVIDIDAEARKKGMDGEMSFKLLNMITDAEKSGRQVVIVTPFNIGEFRKLNITPDALIALVQVDAMLGKNDFRADERTMQFISGIRHRCADLVIQTRQPRHPVFSYLDEQPLLEERRLFNLPPYTRLIDILEKRGGKSVVIERITLKKDSTLQDRKREILERYSGRYLIDVDPL